MSEREDSDFLRDIQEAIRRIRLYTDAMTYEQFLTDIKTQDAVVRNLEIIGEATKQHDFGRSMRVCRGKGWQESGTG
jgi:uncharacterized protein with HEPN domain